METQKEADENVKNYIGSLFDAPVDIIVHQCNCFNTWGAGLAKQMKQRYPRAYESDLCTQRGDIRKLGQFTVSYADDGKLIINLYGQFRYGRKGVFTEEKAVYDGLVRLDDFLRALEAQGQTIGFPHGMGAGLGGGDWNKIEKIIRGVFKSSQCKVLICKLDEESDLGL